MSKKDSSKKTHKSFSKLRHNAFSKVKEEFFQKSTFSIFEVLILMLLAIVFGLWIGYIITYHRNSSDKNVAEIVDTYYDIMDGYYDDVDGEKLSDAAIQGMISSLKDPYSIYMNENNTSSFQDTIKGSFVGIGVTVSFEESGYHRILDLVKDGPAEKAGLMIDDVIIEVDGKSVKDVDGDDFTKLVRGKRGTKIKVKVQRGEEEKEFTMKRDTIEIDSVTKDIIPFDNKTFGYIRIDNFASNTYSQFSKVLKDVEKQNIDALIIDVRDNPGGYLLQTQQILSMFFPRKTLLYQIQTKNYKKKIFSNSTESRDYPIAVLINNASASASEVFASSFQDNYDNSVIVGENSYGKGTIQKPQYLKNGTSIKFTTQKWLTSKGKDLEGKGVVPDVEVEQSDDYYQDPSVDSDVQLQEAMKQVKESMK